jgi:hypothetical protein
VGAEECAAKLGPELAAKGRFSYSFRQIKALIPDDKNCVEIK